MDITRQILSDNSLGFTNIQAVGFLVDRNRVLYGRNFLFLSWDNTQTTPSVDIYERWSVSLRWNNTEIDPEITVT